MYVHVSLACVVRLTPLYMVAIMVWTCITPFLAKGPFDLPSPDQTNCRTYWWHNLLYINNLVARKYMVGLP